ncbi:hypothetical protein Saro_3773 (plasmid) [Novosphingobium aromaticivorans DSM 12444]|uniref:DUF1214 domain-containing protein n=1 Tax=Novosphingobium aromaticivorans (strain ATCC 700278 / DSM 12444 / CCUG 56034 / CIP 105152 / NBRC 16084 / F199) TaxID=279238 RepID=A4XFC1_NOVAD|nr:DUF1214 domain-containing protein [Novosphingobium aromaticivorans]ABP64632.1 hypothetical protein Saro_3773 [Novosphingobium aromaticivorans DSM 12444]SCY92062.1 Protein of unknown function [Novosphingobium aromaticivorans]
MNDPRADVGNLQHVWRRFCAELAEAGDVLARPSSPTTALDQAEGLRYLSRLARTALNMLVDSADPDFPRLFMLCDDKIKIGADNPDNIYQQCVVRPDREYRITGRRNSVPYFSIGSKANRYAIDGTMASTGEIEFADMAFEADGSFEIIVSREKKPGNWLPMADDTSLLIVRQTFDDKKTQVPADIFVERIGSGPAVPALLTPDDIERQLLAAAAWTKGTANTFATWSEWFKATPNRFFDADQSVFQKAGGDPNIWYGHFYYDLQPGEALVIETPVPECRMWNLQIDNWWMESLDHVHQKVWVNNSMVTYEPDGSVVLVCAEKNPGFGNWVDIAGHLSGTGLWRWINATQNVVPTMRVVKL